MTVGTYCFIYFATAGRDSYVVSYREADGLTAIYPHYTVSV